MAQWLNGGTQIGKGAKSYSRKSEAESKLQFQGRIPRNQENPTVDLE